MQRFYLICERQAKGKSRFLGLVRDGKLGRDALRRFARQSTHEVYMADVVTKEVVARLNLN
jgi:hypothetical protein